jgi:divalent metal cation (Fe/Co/Zn/Cd) transporter
VTSAHALADDWDRAATVARRLAWVSLIWMSVEAAVGLTVGLRAGAISLVGWAAGSGVEGLAAAVIIWRFSRGRLRSDDVERRAQQLVALSFWVLAPYIAVEAGRHLLGHERPAATSVGLVLTAIAVIGMPILGRAKHRLADRLGSAATAGEGSQNYLCALQAAAVLLTLSLTAASHSAWWLDPAVALGLAAWAVREGRTAWRGDDCC